MLLVGCGLGQLVQPPRINIDVLAVLQNHQRTNRGMSGPVPSRPTRGGNADASSTFWYCLSSVLTHRTFKQDPLGPHVFFTSVLPALMIKESTPLAVQAA
jgi:hypothetical protein